MRLHGSCTLDGHSIAVPTVRAGDDQPFGTTIAQIPNGMPHDSVWFGMQLAQDGDGFTVNLATMFQHPWALPAPLVTVTKHGLHAHDTVSLNDDTTLRGRAIDCTATLEVEPMAVVSAPISSDEITAKIASFDLPLPNRVTCGLAMKFASPIAPYVTEHLDEVLRLSAQGFAVTTSQEGDRTIVFRVDAHGWDVYLQMEPVAVERTIAETIRSGLGQTAQFENVPCASTAR